MNKNHTDAIIKNNPKLFKTLTHIECDDGWYYLISELCKFISSELDLMSLNEASDYYVVQIKSKFGSLRFYMNEYTTNISSAIALAEQLSFNICEICGELSYQNSSDYIHSYTRKTLCAVHLLFK